MKENYMQNTPVQTLKGFRDFLPEEKRKRDYVIAKMKAVYERFGFEPIETPTLEYADLLLGKYGDEADKLVYNFKDRGDRAIALRYDQTVPTARILATSAAIKFKTFFAPTSHKRVATVSLRKVTVTFLPAPTHSPMQKFWLFFIPFILNWG
jgi:Histidyl-tRNA synthetase